VIYEENITLSKYASNAKAIEYEIDSNECWICTSHKKDKDGYAKVNRFRKEMRMHRYIYEREVGEIPEGYVLLHICDNPSCINPKHMRPGTNEENQYDKIAKGRQAKGTNNGSAKITEEDVRMIRKDTRTCRDIAADYGINYTTVSAIKRRIIWKHIS
jgi:hypothetical protein